MQEARVNQRFVKMLKFKKMNRIALIFVAMVLALNTTWSQTSSIVESDSLMYKKLPGMGVDDHLIIRTLENYFKERPPGDSSAVLGELILSLGQSYNFLRRSQPALRRINESLDILTNQDSVDSLLISQAEYQLSVTYLYLKRYAMAASWAKKSIKTGEKVMLRDSSLKTEQRVNGYRLMAANIANYNSDFELSEFYLNTITARGCYDGTGNTSNYTERQIAAVRAQRAIHQNDLEVAIERLLELKQVFVGEPERLALVELNLAITYIRNGDFHQAHDINESAIRKITAFYEQGDSSRLVDLVILYAQEIEILSQLGQFDQVPVMLKKGLEYANVFSSSKINYYNAELYSKAAFAARIEGEVAKAETYLDSAIIHLVEDNRPIDDTRMVRIQGNVIFNYELLLTCLLSQQKIHFLAYEQGNLNQLRLAVKCHSSIDSLVRLSRDQLSLISDVGTAVEKSRKDYNYSMVAALKLYAETGAQKDLITAWEIIAFQKSNLLSRYLNGATLADALNVPKEIVDRKAELELRLIQLEGEAGTATGKEYQDKVDSIIMTSNQVKAINEQLALDYPKLDNALRGRVRLDFKSAIKKIPEDAAVIEYFIGEDSIYAYALHREGIDVRSLELIKDLQEKVTEVVTDNTLAESLYDRLLADILADLPASVNRLQIIPDGILWNLPFSALSDRGRFLIFDYAISYAYSAGLLFDEKLRAEVKNALSDFAGFGLSYDAIIKDIQATGTRSSSDRTLLKLAGLPYAREEVATIGKLTNGDTWLDEDATKQHFLDAIPGHQQFHLAMHGLTDPENPMENALVFAADDPQEKYALFTTREILAQKIPARLAVLSACHTGAGPLESSEGIQSMARAFTFSGVKATLASRWEASDKVTHDIIIRFYQELEKGEPLDRAQQIATIAYLNQASPADQRPELWANLSLTGFTEPIHGGVNWRWFGMGVVILGLFGYAFTRFFKV